MLEVHPTQGSTNWGEYLQKLRNRGVEQVDLIVADGITYFEDEVKKKFPESSFQKCVVHLQRRLMNKVRPKECTKIGGFLKITRKVIYL